MALSRAAGVCRLALRTQWTVVRLLSSTAAGAESLSDDKKGRRLVDLEALRRERALRPPAERRQLAPTRKAAREQVQLNGDIQACASAEAVLGLVSSRLAAFNEVNAATALLTISRRVGKNKAARWVSGDARFAQLLSAAKLLFGQMAPQELSNTLYACGQLGIVPPADWLEQYWHVSAPQLGEFNPQNLSNTIYACGQLGITPPAGWLQRYWLVSAPKLGDFKTQDFSNTLYACGQLGIAPSGDWLQRFWHTSGPKLGEFTPQELSNALYACGQLGIAPPAEWLQRSWHVSASKLGEFKPQELSNTLYACGQLCVTPPADWLQRFWHASATKLGEFKPQELSNTLYACGQQGINPPSAWLQCFSDSFERSLLDANSQDLSNTTLSLTILGLWELPLWRSLWERLCNALLDTAGWNADSQLHARQLYQTYQAAAVERPGLLPAPVPELLAAARKCWIDVMVDRSSKLHDQVSACLTRMGVMHANEQWCERAERSIDIAIEGAVVPIALEVDGPTHFLQDGRQDGSTQLRNRMLAAHGWRVVVVDYRVWQHQLQTEAQREEYLRDLLA